MGVHVELEDLFQISKFLLFDFLMSAEGPGEGGVRLRGRSR